MIFGANFDYERYKKFGVWTLIIAILLLALCFTPMGVENYGAKRWIKVGPITIQPSEIAKICYIIFSGSYFAKNPGRTKTFRGALPIIVAGGGICVLIILEPNMSITMCFGMLMLALLFASGVKIKHFALILAPIVLLVPILIIAEPYRLNRLSAFLNPWASPKGEGYQLLQSLYALGSGGWFGVGLFNSRQKFKFLPFSESDFIPIIGIIYVVTSISVILQVAHYKRTGKRIFLMAPLHHHFQHKGYSESKIGFIYKVITFIAGGISVISCL